MQNRLFVGNLVRGVSATTLQELFEPFGFVMDVKLVDGGNGNEALGFAFVIMATDEAARSAMAGLNGVSLHGAAIRVEVAQADVRFDSGARS
jgi:RNA recognition motif-containing protein